MSIEDKKKELEAKLTEQAKEVRAIEQHYWKKIGVLEDLQTQYKCLTDPDKKEKGKK